MKKSEGFTLLEVLIAVGIIAVVFVTFIQLNVFNLMSVNKSTTMTNLLFLTKQKISELEVTDLPETGAQTGDFDGYPGYKWKEVISNFSVLEGLRRVEISVSSPDGQINNIIIYKAQ